MNIWIKRILIFSVSVIAIVYSIAAVYYYRKASRKIVASSEIPETKTDTLNLVTIKEVQMDFEEVGISEHTSTENFYSGRKSCRLSPESEYGATISQYANDFSTSDHIKKVDVSFRLFSKEDVSSELWVLELNDASGKAISWESVELPEGIHKWDEVSVSFNIKKEFENNFYRIKTYSWNRNKQVYFIDDVKAVFTGYSSSSEDAIATLKKSSFYFDLETDSLLERNDNSSEDVAHSGKKSSYLNGRREYSAWCCKTLGDVMNDTITSVSAGVWVYPLSDDPNCTLAFEVRTSDDEQLYWNGKATDKMHLKAKKWQKVNAIFNIGPEDYRKFSSTDKFCFYVLNNTRSKIYVDDFEISIGPVAGLKGNKSYVDMNALGDRPYEFVKNHPPYHTVLLNKNDINNQDSDFLVNADGNKSGDLKSADFIAVGNFTGVEKDKDELLTISNGIVEIFHYCKNKNRFTLAGKVTSSIDAKKIKIVTGDFDGNGKKDLLILKKDSMIVMTINISNFNLCTDNSAALNVTIVSTVRKTVNNDFCVAGNFSPDPSDELFFCDSVGNYSFCKADGKTISTGKLSLNFSPENVSVTSGRFINTSLDQVFLLSKSGKKFRADLISLKNNSAKTESISLPDFNSFVPGCELHFIPGKNAQLISFSAKSRFDMMLYEFSGNSLAVNGNVNFYGYSSDQSPRYYEFPRVINGNFRGNGQDVLMILSNCADDNFDGKKCNHFESIPDLPNSVQLYTF